MPTSFRSYACNQTLLLPPSLNDWLPEGHLAYFISDTVDTLDLHAFHKRYEGDGRRRQPFDPAMMVKVLVYAYATGVFSSRKIATRLKEDVAFRVLAADNFPAHRTIREFRQLHLSEFQALFVQVVQMARETGLVKLGRIGIDGTKVKANASKRKAMSYKRLREEQARLKTEIAELIQRAQHQDTSEDQQYGEGDNGNELPDELARREDRLRALEQAKARLEVEQAAADDQRGRSADDHRRPPSGRGKPYSRDYGIPQDKAQTNFTDPDSRIMKTNDGFQQCYNAQASVDDESQLIVATTLNNQASDTKQLLPMIEATRRNTGLIPKITLADAGYASEANFTALEQQGLEACVALGREGKKGRAVNADKHPATQRMAERMASEQGQAHYRRRKVIPEPVFGWIKQAMGFRQFSLRGKEKVKGEWDLVCLALNLRRMHRLNRAQA